MSHALVDPLTKQAISKLETLHPKYAQSDAMQQSLQPHQHWSDAATVKASLFRCCPDLACGCCVCLHSLAFFEVPVLHIDFLLTVFGVQAAQAGPPIA